MFNALTGLKIEILLLFRLPLSREVIKTILELSRNTLFFMFVFMTSDNGRKKTFAASLTTLSGIVSSLTAPYI